MNSLRASNKPKLVGQDAKKFSMGDPSRRKPLEPAVVHVPATIPAKSNLRKSAIIQCRNPIHFDGSRPSKIETSVIPKEAADSKLTAAKLAALPKVTYVHYGQWMIEFGMTASNGECEISGFRDLCNFCEKLPANLTRIDVAFRKGEHNLHSMKFYGSTVVEIGYTDDMLSGQNSPDDYKGRVETFSLMKDEELLGCEIHHDSTKKATYGVTWLVRTRPAKN